MAATKYFSLLDSTLKSETPFKELNAETIKVAVCVSCVWTVQISFFDGQITQLSPEKHSSI